MENSDLIYSGSKGGKSGGGSGRVAVEDPDSLQSLEIARVVDLISEGEIEGLVSGYQSIYLDDVPLQNADGTFNFSDVTIEYRNGTQNQLPLTNAPGVESETLIDTEITFNNPVEISITDSNVSSVYLKISTPQLTQQDTKTGDLHGASIALKASLSSGGGAFNPIPTGFILADNPGTYHGESITLRNATVVRNTSTGYNSIGGWVSSSSAGYVGINNFQQEYVSPLSGSGDTTLPAIVGKPLYKEGSLCNTSTIYFGVRVELAHWEYTVVSTIQLRYRKIGDTLWNIYNTYTSSVSRTKEYYLNLYGVQSKFVTYTAAIPHEVGLYEYEVINLDGRLNTKVAIHKVDSMILDYNINIVGKTITKYQRGVHIELTGDAPWLLRVERVTPDSALSSLQNKSWFDSYTEITNVTLNYPNSALIFTGINAKQFSSIPTRGFEIAGIKCKIPANYNPLTREYTGYWNGTFKTAWTDNPAWIFYDIVTNSRYGLGDLIPESLADKWELYAVAQYCDEIVYDGYGQPEPRFTCNLYLQTREDAFKVVSNMASIFRAMAFWAGGQVSVSQDRPSNVEAIFTPANIIDGTFTYTGTSSKTRHNAIKVSWNNPKNQYKLEIEYIEDQDSISRDGLKETEVVAMGCTSRTQAHRLGKWLLYTEQYENETVNFKTGFDGLVVGLGSVIQTQDPYRSGKRLGGRVNFASSTSIDVDSDIIIEVGKTYEITYQAYNPSVENLPNGNTITKNTGKLITKTLTNSPGTTRHLTWTGATTDLAQTNGMWVLAVNDLSLQTWRVVNLKEVNKTQAEITALKYNESKYAIVEQDILPEEIVISSIDVIPNSVTSINYSEYPAYISPGVISNKATISWNSVSGASKYIVTYRDITRNLNSVEVMSSTNSLEIFPIDIGEYSVSVAAISPLGKRGIKTLITMNILGKIAAPSNVTNFNYTFEPTNILLTWDNIPDVDLSYYEIRVGSSWDNGELFKTSITTNETTYTATTYGTYNLWIAAVDTSGNYSTQPTELILPITLPTSTNLISKIEDSSYVLEWTIPFALFSIDYYLIKYGDTWENAVELNRSNTTRFSASVLFSGSRKFWVAAVDIAGNIGNPGTTSISIIPPSGTNVTAQVIDNNVLLYWTDTKQSLPISTYEIRKGNQFDNAIVIGTKSGHFTSVAELSSDTYTYWVVAIDSAGNYGTPSSVITQVSQPRDYQLISSFQSSFSGIKNNATILPNGKMLMPINTVETFGEHFGVRGWNTPQAQVDAGYPVYIEPSTDAAYYEEDIDLGSVVRNARVNVTINKEIIKGSINLSTTISIKENENDAWINYIDTDTVYASQYRYIKIRINAYTNLPDTFKSLLTISSIKLIVDVKTINDGGSIVCNSSDIGGTTVGFNIPFADITSIVVSPIGSTPITATYDFTDVPNPTSFKILLFNNAGTRVSGSASWSAKGY